MLYAVVADPATLRDVRVAADEVPAGAMIRRRLLFRYTLLWMRPAQKT